MVGVVSSIPSGGNFISTDFEIPRCQFCTKMPKMSDLCYLGKTRITDFYSTIGGHCPWIGFCTHLILILRKLPKMSDSFFFCEWLIVGHIPRNEV